MQETIEVKLSKDSARWVVTGGSVVSKDAVYRVITSWPGWRRLPKAESGASIYSAPANALTASHLALAPFKLEWANNARAAAQGHTSALAAARRALSTTPRVLSKYPYPTKRIPLPHQLQAIEAIGQGLPLLADDMGLGKSATSLWAAHKLGCNRILIICPASVKFNWAREVRATLGWPSWVIDGTPKKRADILADLRHNLKCREALHDEGCSGMAVVINYDLLIHLSPEQEATLVRLITSQAVICDESHYLKNRDSARTKRTTRMARFAKHRLMLSGTPIWNMVDDLYSQLELIRPGTWTSYWDFAKRHLVVMPMTVGTRTFQKVRGSKDLSALNTVVNTFQIRRESGDVLGLPPKTYTFPQLELEGDQLKVYKAMKDLAKLELGELDGGTSIFHPQARSAVEAALRCEQIAQGFVGGVPEPLVEKLSRILSKKAEHIPGRPREIIFPESPKVNWLTETVCALVKVGKRPVIMSRFNAPMFWFARHFQCEFLLHGALTSKAKDDLITRFQAGEGEMMFVQVKMAQGFNLHASQDLLFYGRDWAPSTNKQGEGRLHRIGQKGTVNIQIPIVDNTIERMIDKKLNEKSSDMDQALSTVTVRELMEGL